MFSNHHIRSQQVCVAVSKEGHIKRTLVVSTNLNPSGTDFDDVVTSIVEYLKKHDDLDGAEIQCVRNVG
jgi:hypothetical protein